jgi:uncharacterized protein
LIAAAARVPRSPWWAVWVALVWLLAVPAAAREVPQLRARVTDEAGVLAADEVRELDRRLAAYEQATGRQIAVLVVRSLEGDPLEDFSIRVVEAWKLGRQGRDDGILVLLAMEERKARIEVGYGLEGEVTDLVSARIIHDVMRPYLRQDRPGAALLAGVEALVAAAGPGEGAPEVDAPGFWQREVLGRSTVWYAAMLGVLVVVAGIAWRWPVVGVIATLVFAQVWWVGAIVCALVLWLRWRTGRRPRWRDGLGVARGLGHAGPRSTIRGLGGMGLLFGLGRLLSSQEGRGLTSGIARHIGSSRGFFGRGGGFGGGGASGGW